MAFADRAHWAAMEKGFAQPVLRSRMSSDLTPGRFLADPDTIMNDLHDSYRN